MKNLLLRSTTGLIYVAVIILALTLGNWAFLAMCLLLSLSGIFEFYTLCNTEIKQKKKTLAVDMIGAVILIVSFFASMLNVCSSISKDVYLLPYLSYILIRMVMQLYTKEISPLNNLAYSLMGQIYVALPFGLMSLLYFDYATSQLLLVMFIMIWLNDTGAYLVGCTIGKHKMFPRISPKKSWEGFVGGVIFAIGGAVVAKMCFAEVYQQLNLSQMIGLAIVVTICATLGDLIESLIKRTLGVKDSGKMLPGHGGMLDRIDSLLLVVPGMLCYMMLLNILG